MPNRFAPPRGLDAKFASHLRKVARVATRVVLSYARGHIISDSSSMMKALLAYSASIAPWAERIAGSMLGAVVQNNLRAWAAQAGMVGAGLRELRSDAALGSALDALRVSQVELIKSIPIEAGRRAQELANTAAADGTRAAEVAAEIYRTNEVTENRAMLIARTEIAKANAAVTQVRSALVGATHYIWQTAEDADVRDSHADMAGGIFAFDDPPEVEGEGRHGPGEFPNCRCFAEPIIQ